MKNRENTIFGIHPILEALNSELVIDKLFIQKESSNPKIQEIETKKINAKQIYDSKKNLKFTKKELKYFTFHIQTKNKIYDKKNNPIKIMHQKGNDIFISNIEKDLHFNKHQNTIIKNFICFPKGNRI